MNAVAENSVDTQVAAVSRFLRARLIARLSRLRHARLQVCDFCGVVELGASADPALPTIRLEVLDPAFYRLVALGGSVGAGEAYMEGMWRCSVPGLDAGQSLVALVRLLIRNRDLLDGLESGLTRLGTAPLRAWHAARRNTRDGSRRNIAAHYDLGNDFFRLFLSRDMMYSSALWQGASDMLDSASARKLETICRRLQLGPSDHLVEIGTGWGAFAIHAARQYGCRVTTTTISREQHAFATARVAEAGLQGRVDVRLEDYRDLGGRYDKLVSIEMIEAVGAPHLDTYFGMVDRLLKPQGLALLQAITIEDHRYLTALRSVDFIKRHVFPGSFIPSVNALLAAKTRASELALVALEDFGDSYARTLSAWRGRFMARLPEVRAQGFDERFIRRWEFYLAYCEGGFRERAISVAHLLLAKPGWRRSPSIADRELG